MDIYEFFMKTYTIALPIILGYIVWLLQEGKKTQKKKRAEDEERHKEEVKKNEANSKGTMLMLRYMLYRYHTEYMAQGFITSEQFRGYEELFNAYRDLGGNSVAVMWYDEVKQLEVKDDVPVGLTSNAKKYLKNKYGDF